MTYLALAAVLMVIAIALLAFSLGRSPRGDAVRSPVATSTGDASPGSTAHARHLYRVSLGR